MEEQHSHRAEAFGPAEIGALAHLYRGEMYQSKEALLLPKRRAALQQTWTSALMGNGGSRGAEIGWTRLSLITRSDRSLVPRSRHFHALAASGA